MGALYVRNCLLTGEEAEPVNNNNSAIMEYNILVNDQVHLIRLNPLLYTKIDSSFIQSNKHLFFGLIYNNEWFEDENHVITENDLKDLLDSKSIPQTPDAKLERLFLRLFNFQNEDGEEIKLPTEVDRILWKALYFRSPTELNYYLQVLHQKNLIDATFSITKRDYGFLDYYRITFAGLNYAIKLNQNGENSNKCFVAMSFRNETLEVRKAIKVALKQTGFEPIIVDEQNVDSDRTINDEIIASLKKCRFCIADFSFHSNGVYFESGYALGQGKKVIYTCSQEEFKNAHFDIKPLQHIIYKDTEELEKKLVLKIEAWIK